MERVITISYLTIDLDRIKAVKLNNFTSVGKTNVLTVEYNARVEYSRNPFTNEIEKTQIIDTVTKEYPDYSTAQAYQMELEEAWREYLQTKKDF